MRFRNAIACIAALFLAPALASAEAVLVEVGHGTFSPVDVSIQAGDTVEFKNVEEMPGGHTVAIEELGAESDPLGAREKWSYTFEEAGTYEVYVKEHPEGRMTIKVE